MIAKPDRAKYKTKQVENDSKIDAKTTEEIAEFLETFFKLYPSASEKNWSIMLKMMRCDQSILT